MHFINFFAACNRDYIYRSRYKLGVYRNVFNYDTFLTAKCFLR